MQSIRQHLEPIHKLYNRYLNGAFLTDLLEIKGGTTVGNDYVSKVFYSNTNQIHMKYDSALESTRNPTLLGLLSDNWHRLLLLNAFQRLVVAYQAYPTLKQRFGYPGTYSHTFTEIMNQGAFRGTLKGLSMSLLQFSGIMFPAVYLTAKSDSDSRFQRFLINYTVMDTLLYPLDTIKNILYADTLGKYSIYFVNSDLKTLLSRISFGYFYAGYFPKMIYNVPVLSGIYFTTQVGQEREAWLSWLAAAVFYPLNTLKVCNQVSASELTTMKRNDAGTYTIRHGYRGVFTYLAINMLVGWSLRPLFNHEKLEQIRQEVQQEAAEYMGVKNK